MKSAKVIIFAGTTEGRRLTEYLIRGGVRVCACTATEYGGSLMTREMEKNPDSLTLRYGRMDCEEMCRLIEEEEPYFVVDATHPYAREVTENIRDACACRQVKYLRLLRKAGEVERDSICVESVEEAAAFLEHTEGNILVTTGSKELEKYTVLTDYKERIYARVLSVQESVRKCEELGIRGRHLICMQGPFSTEMNQAVLREFQIAYMVTKESGAAGGYPQKCEAAEACGVKLVVIGRPKQEEGYTYKEIIKYIKKEINLQNNKKVYIVGIGPGAKELCTKEALTLCHEADVLIGAERMVEAVAREAQNTVVSYRPDEILAYIKEHPEYEKVTVVMSGDTGFYSGTAKLLQLLREEKIEAEIVPGISSISSFCAKTGITWEDAALVSVHGKKENMLAVIRENKKTIALTGSGADVRNICRTMTEAGYGDLRVVAGARLSYADEKITEAPAREYRDYDGNGLAVLYIANPGGGESPVTYGLPDKTFVRGDVPMTKEEVRSVILSKLRIRRNSVIYDVGAGTGSVAVEAAVQAVKGHVYAVERKESAVELIRENGRRMKTENLTVVKGEAPGALAELPAPDIVFVGGSGGNLKEILSCVIRKNPGVRVVISAITLETAAEAVQCAEAIRKKEEDMVQISVAKAKQAGRYHMMMGQNPVTVISFTCDEEG